MQQNKKQYGHSGTDGNMIQIADCFTLLISHIGVFVSVIYIIWEAFRSYDTKADIEEEQKSIEQWLKENDQDNNKNNRLKIILADYASGNEEVRRRDNVTLLVGSILITSSFIILGNVMLKSDLPISIFSLASIGLFLIWLLALHETGKKENKITYDHLKAIEAALTQHFKGQDGSLKYSFGTHYLICRRSSDQKEWWLRGRRMFWAFVLLLLSIAWMLLSLKLN